MWAALENIATVLLFFVAGYAATKMWRTLVRDVFAWSFMIETYREIVAKNGIHRPEEIAQWQAEMEKNKMRRGDKSVIEILMNEGKYKL